MIKTRQSQNVPNFFGIGLTALEFLEPTGAQDLSVVNLAIPHFRSMLPGPRGGRGADGRSARRRSGTRPAENLMLVRSVGALGPKWVSGLRAHPHGV